MQDETLVDQPGVELDAEMIQQILANGNKYSEQTAQMAQFINSSKQNFRKYLEERNYIQVSKTNVEGFDLAAVDGGSATHPHGGGALVAAAAYKSTLNDERQHGATKTVLVPNSTELESLAALLRIHLEFALLVSDYLDSDRLVILDHSFWGVMQAVSRALTTYKSQRNNLVESGRNVNLDAMQRIWRDLFKECLGIEGSFVRMIRNKQVVSLSKTGISQYFVNLFLASEVQSDSDHVIGSTLNDRAFLHHVLEPGEYITPQSLYRTIQEGGNVKSWKRSRFAAMFDPTKDDPDPFEARQTVFDEYGLPRDDDHELPNRRIFVTYYRPHRWGRTYRIEFHERMLISRNVAPITFDLNGQSERFQRVLASVKQSVNPEIKEPLAQVLADLRAKATTAAALAVLPERTFYQLRDQYRGSPDILEIIDTLMAEERT